MHTMVHTSFMKAAISLLNPNNIKHFGLGSIGGKQSPLIRETEHIEYESSPSEWAILLTTQKFVPSTFSTPRLIKKTTSIITTFHNSESKDQAWKQKNHSLGSKELNPILHNSYIFLCLLAFALWIMLFVLGRTTTYIFHEDRQLDINEHALHGLGVVFSKGNRAMENLIIANLEEGCSLIDFRLFLRTLYRSGAMARADLVLLFPWSTTIPEHVLGIVSEEGRSFRRLRSLMDSTQTLDSAPCISIFNRTAFETPKDPRGESEASRKWSDALWGKSQEPSSTHGDEHKGPSSIECGRGDDVASMQHGDDHKRPSMKCGNGDLNPKHGGEERHSIIWGHGGVASSTNGDKRSWADLLGLSAHESKRSSSSSSISEETGNEFNFGSVFGFQINELDSTDGFSGFLMDPSSRLRRWLCYQMLLGLLKHKFEQVMLVELGGVVVLGDVFMHPNHGDFLHFTAQDSTWEEAILQKPSGDSEKVHKAALVQGKYARDVMIKKTLYNNEVKDKEKNGIKERGACDFNETETPKKAKNPSMVKEEKETMFERLYGKELWKSLDKWEKKRKLMSSGVILGSMRATKGLVNAMVVEVVRVAMKKEKTNLEFPDEVLLSYLVQKSPHLLGKKVTENLQILSNKESMAHCLDGSKQEHVFQRTIDGQRYSVLQHASSLNISQFQGSRLDIAQLIMYDICSSSIDMSLIYEDCIHYR